MSMKANLEAASIYYPAGGTSRFIPQGDFERLLNVVTVRSELLQCLPDHLPGQEQQKLAETICAGLKGNLESSFRKVFATLILVGICHRILDFVEHDVDDSRLPLHEEELVEHFYSWDSSTTASFLKEQWTFLSPIFTRVGNQPNHYHFTVNHILPVIEDGGVIDEPTSGYQVGNPEPIQILPRSSLLKRIKLHPEHCRFDDFKEVKDFTLKRFPAFMKSRFLQELNNLKSLQYLNDPYIIPLLASFEIPSLGYYLLFPYATGNLELLWITRSDLVGSSEAALWMSEQCYHVTHALARVHGSAQEIDQSDDSSSFFAIIHGDLRPANILWFTKGAELQDSKLVIADWGSAEPDLRLYLEPTTRLKSIGRSYRPPECDDPDGHISTALDIWALGCIFLEFVTWSLLGWEAVEDIFAAARSGPDPKRPHLQSDIFFSQKEGRWVIKPQVQSWAQELTELRKCSPCIRDVLGVIMDYMLKVDLTQRATARNLALEFRNISSRCKKDPNYYQVINPSQR